MEQTHSCQRGGGLRDWRKEGEEINQRNIYMTHRHRQQCSEGQREGGAGVSGGGQRWGDGGGKRLCSGQWVHDAVGR